MNDKGEDRRMSLIIANSTESGEIEIVARVNNSEEITILSRSVAAALVSSVTEALAEAKP